MAGFKITVLYQVLKPETRKYNMPCFGPQAIAD
jgi:hypothetical protein